MSAYKAWRKRAATGVTRSKPGCTALDTAANLLYLSLNAKKHSPSVTLGMEGAAQGSDQGALGYAAVTRFRLKGKRNVHKHWQLLSMATFGQAASRCKSSWSDNLTAGTVDI